MKCFKSRESVINFHNSCAVDASYLYQIYLLKIIRLQRSLKNKFLQEDPKSLIMAGEDQVINIALWN